jgi:hypothetical protein
MERGNLLPDDVKPPRDPRVAVHAEARCKIIIDERFAPLYVAFWMGVPSETPIRAYFEWSARRIVEARAGGRHIAIVCDAAEGERPPPKLRALMAELSDATPRAEDLVAVYVSIPSALVRGALTAMQWLSRKPWPMQMVPSLTEGFERARRTLAANGVALPAEFDPARYRRPA